MGDKKEFYSLDELAALLQVNYQLVYKLVRSGELPSARIGKVYRVMRSDLQAFLDRSKAQTSGGTCAACGKTYASRLSLSDACVECGAPICADCWSRGHVRYCSNHGRKAGKPVKSDR